MTSKQELRDEIGRVSNDRDLWKMEANALRNQRDEAVRGRDGWRRTADVVVRQRDEAIAERDNLRARVAELEAAVTTPEPRPWCARPEQEREQRVTLTLADGTRITFDAVVTR